MTTSVVIMSILFFVVIRVMIEIENKKKNEVDDIYNVKKKKGKGKDQNGVSGTSAAQAGVFGSAKSGSSAKSLHRTGY